MKSKIYIIALSLSLIASACNSNTATTNTLTNSSTNISSTIETDGTSSNISTAVDTQSTFINANEQSSSSVISNQATQSPEASPKPSPSVKSSSNKANPKKSTTSKSETNKPSNNTITKQPMEKAELFGEVSTISDNKIILKLIEMPSLTAGTRPQRSSDKSSGETKPDSTQVGSQPPQRTVKYTGESKTIVVSDSVPITTTVRVNNVREQKTITLKDIKQGDTLQIWYSDKTKEIIEKISVMSNLVRNTSNTSGN